MFFLIHIVVMFENVVGAIIDTVELERRRFFVCKIKLNLKLILLRILVKVQWVELMKN